MALVPTVRNGRLARGHGQTQRTGSLFASCLSWPRCRPRLSVVIVTATVVTGAAVSATGLGAGAGAGAGAGVGAGAGAGAAQERWEWAVGVAGSVGASGLAGAGPAGGAAVATCAIGRRRSGAGLGVGTAASRGVEVTSRKAAAGAERRRCGQAHDVDDGRALVVPAGPRQGNCRNGRVAGVPGLERERRSPRHRTGEKKPSKNPFDTPHVRSPPMPTTSLERGIGTTGSGP